MASFRADAVRTTMSSVAAGIGAAANERTTPRSQGSMSPVHTTSGPSRGLTPPNPTERQLDTSDSQAQRFPVEERSKYLSHTGAPFTVAVCC